MPSTRQRRPSPTAQRLKASTKDHSRRTLLDWLTLTFGQDRQSLAGPVTPTVLNWLFLVAMSAWIYLAGFSMTALYLLLAWLIVTLIRAAYVQRRRRDQLATIFSTLAPVAKLPAGTASHPTDPSRHIRKIKWGARALPETFTATLNSAAPAATAPLLRVGVESAIENLPHALSKSGGEWLCTWDRATVTAQAVPANDPRLTRKAYTRKITALIVQIFRVPATPAAASGWNVTIKDWDSAPTADGGASEYPTGLAVRCADRDLSDPVLRDQVERQIERAIPIPGEWLFTWDPATSSLSVDHADAESLDAKRKRTQRRLRDDISALVPARGKDPVVLDVIDWVNPEMDLPRTLHVSFGTLAVDDSRLRDQIEDRFDAAIVNRWSTARALFDWQHGATTELDITLVSHNDPKAQQRSALTRFRNVTNAKFGSARNPVTTEVLEWQPEISASGVALPQVARVNFGTVDVTKSDTKDAFQDHWDSIDNNMDWHYAWDTAAGYVEMRAVSKLPDAVAFPDEDAPDRKEIQALFRAGKVFIGLQKGGGWFVWDLNKIAHGLIGGSTGAGKSVLLDTILQGILTNRDLIEVVVCDLKMTDFAWTPEFPNTIVFAGTPQEACLAVAATKDEMERRKSLCNKRGVRNLGQLRALYARQPELEAEDGPCPRRRFLFFDEIGEFLAKSKDKDLEELLDVARSDLESIGRLARAFEINIVAAAQKPEAQVVSTQLKLQMQFRVCVGPVDEYTSKQILESNHGTRFPPAVPKGRAWAWTSASGFHLIQVPFLPSATEPAPWDPSLTIEGSRERLRAGLEAEGWMQIQVANSDGGQDPRWVRVEDDDPQPAIDAAQPDRDADRLPIGLPDNAADAYLPVDDFTPSEDVADLDDRAPLGDGPAVDPFSSFDVDPPWDTSDPADITPAAT
ncbi:FtsK/SpoIIIE domain-containing protein [Gordonia phosphorivorans]|uniref:FtsK/SpoIIIE domain-containing protein n=1 Tax=Gordonia phosphorivorans TaxID=1056982 RepID=A0ABV6H3Z4_9ACTN